MLSSSEEKRDTKPWGTLNAYCQVREGSAARVHTLGSQRRDIIGRVRVSFGVWAGHEWRETEVLKAVQVYLLSNKAVYTQRCTHRGAHSAAHTQG